MNYRVVYLVTILLALSASAFAATGGAQPQTAVKLAPIDAVAIASAKPPPGPQRTPQLERVIADLRAGRTEQANRGFGEHVAAFQRAGVNVEELVQWVLRESYLQTKQDLRDQAEKVRYFNDAKRRVRDYLQELRDMAQSMTRSSKPAPKGVLCLTWPRIEARPCELTKDQIDKEIAAWEAHLNELGDDAQLANVDLQNILQKQQQTLQMMSNISKMLYDTANSVIRKMGG